MARKQNTIKNQLTNQRTFLEYYNEFESLGCNVLNCTLQPYQDKTFFNYKMFYRGSLAGFYDDVMEQVLILPWQPLGKLDIYNRPTTIEAFSKTYRRKLNPGEYVIIYDNLMHKPLAPRIKTAAERLALIRRVIDVNIKQQKTPRIYKCSEKDQLTMENIVNNIDSCDDAVFTFDTFEVQDLEVILTPAPYVADKLELEFEKIWSETLKYLGVASVVFEKKERMIKDEVQLTQGGTIANRYNRFNSYKECFELMNEKFGDKLIRPFEVEFYDGLPTTLTDPTDDDQEVLEDE